MKGTAISGCIDYSRYEFSKKERKTFFLTVWVCSVGTGYLFYDSLLYGALLCLVCFPAYKSYENYKKEKRKHQLLFQFKDMLHALSASLSSGRDMRQAICDAEDNLRLIYDAGEPICVELKRIVRRMYDGGESEEMLLRDFAERSGIEDIKSFVDVYGTCRSTGGDINEAMAKTSAMLVDKISIRREIQTLTAQKRLEAKILTSMPFILLLLLKAFSPGYIQPMYESGLGRMLMTIAVLGIGTSYVISMKMTNIEV